jgi:hypothetical protein
MPLPNLNPAMAALAAFGRLPPPPWQSLLRSTGYRLRPPRPWEPGNSPARDAVLASGLAEPRQLSTVLCERRGGPVPTIVVGGFVPDAPEQVFLLRGFLLRQGSVFYANYPRRGFSAELFGSQLDDLVADLNRRRGRPPVVLAVSFGAGIVLDWLGRRAAAGSPPDLAGCVLVSPVACAADLVAPGEAKPQTLAGRALRPYLEAGPEPDPAIVEKSRTIFAKMFEAGAQNQESLLALMSPEELRTLHSRVMGSIRDVDPRGAWERVRALREMSLPRGVLSRAPALVLYAEKEGSVLDPRSPTRTVLESSLEALFPSGRCLTVAGGVPPVQHASLIFHHHRFLPPIANFYRGLRARRQPLAA